MSQKEKIMSILKTGVELTSLDGLKIGVIRVGNRINELIHSGVPIKSRWLVSSSGARFKSYYITEADRLLLSDK